MNTLVSKCHAILIFIVSNLLLSYPYGVVLISTKSVFPLLACKCRQQCLANVMRTSITSETLFEGTFCSGVRGLITLKITVLWRKMNMKHYKEAIMTASQEVFVPRGFLKDLKALHWHPAVRALWLWGKGLLGRGVKPFRHLCSGTSHFIFYYERSVVVGMTFLSCFPVKAENSGNFLYVNNIQSNVSGNINMWGKWLLSKVK